MVRSLLRTRITKNKRARLSGTRSKSILRNTRSASKSFKFNQLENTQPKCKQSKLNISAQQIIRAHASKLNATLLQSLSRGMTVWIQKRIMLRPHTNCARECSQKMKNYMVRDPVQHGKNVSSPVE